MNNNLVHLATIVAPHGVRGQVKVKSFCATPEDIADYSLTTSDGKPVKLQLQGSAGETLIASLSACATRNDAEAWKGTKLYIPESALPPCAPGEYYLHQLMNLTVLQDGKPIGKITQFGNLGAGDLVEIAFDDGRKELFPFNKQTFPAANIAEGTIEFSPPEIEE